MSYKEELIDQIIEQVKREAFWNEFETVKELLWELDFRLQTPQQYYTVLESFLPKQD